MSRNGGQPLLKFMYNDDGIRTNKIVDDVNHVYTLNGTQIVSEAWGTNLLIYLYDESGAPIGMQYRANSYAANTFDTFYFEKNLFGDIVAVYNASGTKIGSYTYDAWGNCTVTLNSAATTADKRIVRNYNPFRYRGYYYDTETQLYYLQSRYYNPTTGRFVNADGYVNANGDLIGFNMYAYCSNNPVMYTDPTGESIVLSAIIIGAIIGGVIGAASSVANQYIEHDGNWDDINILMVIYDGAVGAIGGAISATSIGTVGAMVYGAVSGGVFSFLRDSLFYKDKSTKEKFANAGLNALIGGISGLISGSGANHSNNKNANKLVIENYRHSRTILKNTIANGTNRALNQQFAVTTKYEIDFLISGVRYMAGNLFAFMCSQMEE